MRKNPLILSLLLLLPCTGKGKQHVLYPTLHQEAVETSWSDATSPSTIHEGTTDEYEKLLKLVMLNGNQSINQSNAATLEKLKEISPLYAGFEKYLRTNFTLEDLKKVVEMNTKLQKVYTKFADPSSNEKQMTDGFDKVFAKLEEGGNVDINSLERELMAPFSKEIDNILKAINLDQLASALTPLFQLALQGSDVDKDTIGRIVILTVKYMYACGLKDNYSAAELKDISDLINQPCNVKYMDYTRRMATEIITVVTKNPQLFVSTTTKK